MWLWKLHSLRFVTFHWPVYPKSSFTATTISDQKLFNKYLCILSWWGPFYSKSPVAVSGTKVILWFGEGSHRIVSTSLLIRYFLVAMVWWKSLKEKKLRRWCLWKSLAMDLVVGPGAPFRERKTKLQIPWSFKIVIFSNDRMNGCYPNYKSLYQSAYLAKGMNWIRTFTKANFLDFDFGWESSFLSFRVVHLKKGCKAWKPPALAIHGVHSLLTVPLPLAK